ncbi:DUF1648 domain-containing protein [Rhodococcus sp. Q]|uniref:DUF1648 domain-containing protein n=1 Tax=Rhodococcus sp. Q TaxID=2502252 RepID=UPI0010F96E3C|nr:DUF1648 domain-containing protein [Rhodococcus sp. Q]
MTEQTVAPQVSWVRALVAALAVPVVLAAIALVLFAAWAADLPDPMAVHFTIGGSADGFASQAAARTTVLLGPATAAVLVTVLVLITRRDLRTARMGVTLAAGIGSFLAVLPVLLAIPQRGVADAASVTVPGWWIVAGAAIAVGAAALAHLSMPAPGPTLASAAPGVDAARIPLEDGERVAWSGSAAMPRWFGVLLGVLPIAVVVALMAVGAGSAILLLVVAAISGAVMALVLAPVRVLVDQRGLSARGVVPVRPVHIPLDEVAEARTVTVKVINGFGGYGYRVGPRGVGLIARPGPALEVTRGDGSRFTVTVDGADQAAAVLNTLAARGRV